MNRRRLVLLLLIVVLLVLALLAIMYFLSSLLTPPGTKTIESDSSNGITMTWERSIYGLGTANNEMLDDPVDTAVDEDGLIYVAQPLRSAVWVFENDGSPVRSITSDQFNMPSAVEAGPAGRLFVADKGNSLMFCLDEDGSILWQTQVVRATSMTWADERLYIATFDSIRVLDVDGNELYAWGERGYEQGQLDFPQGVLIRGDVAVVSDGNNARIQAFNTDGAFLWETGASYRDPASEETTETRMFQLPGGLCSGPDERILLTDAFNFDVVALEGDGRLIGRVGSEGDADGKFWYPSSIAALGNDRYVIADTLNDRLQIVRITFGGAGASGVQAGLRGAGNAWCICPTAALILIVVAAVAWVVSGRRERDEAADESGQIADATDADTEH